MKVKYRFAHILLWVLGGWVREREGSRIIPEQLNSVIGICWDEEDCEWSRLEEKINLTFTLPLQVRYYGSLPCELGLS